jgi:hypothetical protein
VVFVSESANLVNGDTNGFWDVFVRDRMFLRTARVSIDSETVQGDAHSQSPRIASGGRFVSFSSGAGNLVPGDTNNQLDIFVHDLDATDFTSLCSPGVDGVMACPCQNPSSGTDRGCENSSLTGGAILSAAGVSYLSQDSLVFTTSGQRPTALSILTQWTGGDPAGATFGMGVRCTSGNFKRLYTKIASGGSITAPDIGASDPEVSVRSAALGQPILPGDSRWYLVYYRDPNVLGGCAASATFKCTQTGQVTWSN